MDGITRFPFSADTAPEHIVKISHQHCEAAPSAELRSAALCWLAEPDAVRKAEGVRRLAQAWSSGAIKLDTHASLTAEPSIPGKPDKPELVPPLSVMRRSMATPEGRAILIHALAHIEFNAIKVVLQIN